MDRLRSFGFALFAVTVTGFWIAWVAYWALTGKFL